MPRLAEDKKVRRRLRLGVLAIAGAVVVSAAGAALGLSHSVASAEADDLVATQLRLDDFYSRGFGRLRYGTLPYVGTERLFWEFHYTCRDDVEAVTHGFTLYVSPRGDLLLINPHDLLERVTRIRELHGRLGCSGAV